MTKLSYEEKAKSLWEAFDENAKCGIRFGLFPADVMREAEKTGYTDSKKLCVALMDCASNDGGMRA